MEIYSLRISRGLAGTKFPFDRVYLVKYDDRACLKELFRYALVMPVEGNLKSALREVMAYEYVNHTFHRDDEEKELDPLKHKEWGEFLDAHLWVLAVPILTKFMKESLPRYLLAAGWYDKRETKRRHGKQTVTVETKQNPVPYPELTYLQTPERNVRPVCVMCPRMVMHQNGECKLGDQICYTSLGLGANDYFMEGANTPAAPVDETEPELNEITDGLIQENDA